MNQLPLWVTLALALAAGAALASPEPTATETRIYENDSGKKAPTQHRPKNSSTYSNDSASDHSAATMGEEPPTTGTGGTSGAAGSTGGSAGAGMGH